MLQEHAFQTRFEYRHRWQPYDVLIWGNRCLMHAAMDGLTETRRMHRILPTGRESY